MMTSATRTGGRTGNGGVARGGAPGTGGHNIEGGGGAGGMGGSTMDAQAPMNKPDVAPPPPDLAAPPVDMRPPELWKPTVGMTWDYQLVTPVNPIHDVQVYNINLFENDAAVIAQLRQRGKKVICHVDFGTYESWHPDADRIPRETLGDPFQGNAERRWLDVRNLRGLLPVMRERIITAVRKGCDAIEPDNLDAWDVKAHEPPGFPITAIDQLIYNRTIAKEARMRGLAVGLKNDTRQIDDLVGDFDFALSEECFSKMECHLLKPFIDAGKPVFVVEYDIPTTMFCPMAKTMKLSAIKKKHELDSTREACP